MAHSKFGILSMAAAGVVSMAGLSHAAEPTAAELSAQVRELQARLSQLESRQTSAATTDATVAKVLADADSRSQLLQDVPFANNFEKGKFMLRSADGNYTLHPWFQFQFRYATAYRDNQGAGGDADTQSGFELRRMKFGFDGNVISPDTKYNFIWSTSRNGGGVSVEEAWVQHTFGDSDFALRAGDFKDPLAHESLTSSKKLLAADRSIVADYFLGGDNFVQGVSAILGDKGPIRAEVAFHDGAGNAYTNFQDPPTNPWDFGVAGRVQYLVMGDWKSYDDFSAMGNKKDLLVIGGGADWSQNGDNNQYLYTADAQYEVGAWGLYGAYVGRYVDTGAGHRHDWGATAQVAYLIDGKIEPFGRYSIMQLETPFAGGEDTVHEITAGANYYMDGHNMKFTVDVVYLPNGTPGASGIDYLAASDTEFVLRGQFQLLI